MPLDSFFRIWHWLVHNNKDFDRRAVLYLSMLVIVVYLIPIWSYSFIPTQDGPSHIENSFILKNLLTDHNSYYHEVFKINPRPVPNWVSHAVMALLMCVTSPLIAEKILVSGYVILFVNGFYFLLVSVHKDKGFYLFLALPFIFNYTFHMGFYNFCISVPLCLLVIAYWWRHRLLVEVSHAIVINFLFIVLYFSHFASYCMALLFITLACIVESRFRIRKLIRHALYFLPAYLIPCYFFFTFVHGAGSGYWGINNLWHYLKRVGSLTSYYPEQDRIGHLFFILFTILIIFTLIERIVGALRKSNAWLKKEDFFLCFCAIGLIVYFFSPCHMAGGGYIPERFAIFPFLFIIPWLSASLPRLAKIFLVSLFLWFAAFYLQSNIKAYKIVNNQMEEFIEGASLMEKGMTYLPLEGGTRSCRPVKGAVRILPMHHAASYFVVMSGVIKLTNYECRMTYFPIIFQANKNIYAYLPNLRKDSHPNMKFWKYPDVPEYITYGGGPNNSEIIDFFSGHYDLIHKNYWMHLYRRKTQKK